MDAEAEHRCGAGAGTRAELELHLLLGTEGLPLGGGGKPHARFRWSICQLAFQMLSDICRIYAAAQALRVTLPLLDHRGRYTILLPGRTEVIAPLTIPQLYLQVAQYYY